MAGGDRATARTEHAADRHAAEQDAPGRHAGERESGAVAGNAAGEVAETPGGGDELPPGQAVTASGRVSVAREYSPQRRNVPFSSSQLASLDEALTLSTRSTGLQFSVYLGELGEDSRGRAIELHESTGADAPHAVLIAVSPGERVVEIVTGAEARRRLPDRSCKLAVMSMVASFKEGDLAGGLVSGLRMLADQAS